MFNPVRLGPATFVSVTPALATIVVLVCTVVMFVVVVLGAKCRPLVQLKLVAARTMCPIMVVPLGGIASLCVVSLVATTFTSACLTLVGRRRRGATPLSSRGRVDLRLCRWCLRLVYRVCCWLVGLVVAHGSWLL